jgi:hypothetical protein
MPATSTLRRASRGSLLAGASTALALFLAASPAAAQSGASATGNRTLANQQGISNADQIVGAENTSIVSASPVTTDASVRLDDNGLLTSASGNQASGTLASDSMNVGYPGMADLNAGTHGVSAAGASVIANRQTVSNANTATVQYMSAITLDGGAVSNSTLSTSGNTQEGISTANGADETIAAAGDGSGGAGIVSYQATDSGSQAAGRANDTVGISALTLSASTLTDGGNNQRGIGTGNKVTTSLDAKVGAINAQGPGLTVPVAMLAAASDPSVSAQYGILTNQSASGLIKGRAGASDDGPAYRVGVSDVVVGSSIVNDDNGLVAAAYGNDAGNSLGVDATSIAAAPDAKVGDITDIQTDEARVRAFTTGGGAIDLGAGMGGSSVSASGNGTRTLAAANLASDSMTVQAVSAGTEGAVPSSPASALTTPDGGAQDEAVFGVQTVQDFGTSAVTASQIRGTTVVNVAGPVVASTVAADTNLRTASTSGNSAASSLDLSADALASTAAVNLMQGGNGNVSAVLGTATDPVGTRVTASRLADSAVSVSSNSESATALGNDGTTGLKVAANSLTSMPGGASAGSLAAGYGATGNIVVASNQKLGAPDLVGHVLPAVTASVVDRSGVNVARDVTGSAVTIDGNSQRANALGNSGANRLDVATNTIDGSAGSALSSSQYGQATIAATSSQTLTAPGSLAASRVSLSNNSNIAFAAVNSVDNGLTVTGKQASGAASQLSSDEMGPPVGSGDAVLANQQFAIGTLDANASTSLSNVGAADRLASSTMTIADNTTLADASANRAQNSVTLGDGVTGGILNTQVSIAPVHAVAASDLRFTAGSTQAALSASALTFDSNVTSATARGNAANNALSYVGTTATFEGSANGQTSTFSASAVAPLTVLNQQANLASVAADTGTSGVLTPLNGAATGSQLSLTGNTMSATAYGNSANNVMTVSALRPAPAASLVNMQTNSGSVTAVVTAANYRSLAGPINGSSVALTGNQINAAATGNLASSVIASGR